MIERLITRGQVESTLLRPDRLSVDDGKLVAERRTSMGNVIRVVYVERLTDQGNSAHVITAIRIAGR
jgi:hypothetical protein